MVTSGARVRVVDIFGIDFNDLLEGQSEPMHGDEVDTSLMLYIAPELVKMELAQDYMMSRNEVRRYRRGWLRVPRESPGSIGRPKLATAEKGRALYERLYTRIRDRVFVAPSPNHEPVSPAGCTIHHYDAPSSGWFTHRTHGRRSHSGARAGAYHRRGHVYGDTVRRRATPRTSVSRASKTGSSGRRASGQPDPTPDVGAYVRFSGTAAKYDVSVTEKGVKTATVSAERGLRG